MKPLYGLLKKNVKWNWSVECKKSFNLVKDKLSSCEVLMQYDPELSIKITIDASPYGVGSVLPHVLGDNKVTPIAYASRTLTKAEQGYSQVDREALGIVFGVKSFYQYVYGRLFVLEIDHKPLVYIFGVKNGLPQIAGARVQRWAVFYLVITIKLNIFKERRI